MQLTEKYLRLLRASSFDHGRALTSSVEAWLRSDRGLQAARIELQPVEGILLHFLAAAHDLVNFPILFLTVSSTVTSNLAATARQKTLLILSEDIATAAASRRHSWSQRNFDRRTELKRIMTKSSQALEVVVVAATILGFYPSLEFDVV